jgi:hypothetical protein
MLTAGQASNSARDEDTRELMRLSEPRYTDEQGIAVWREIPTGKYGVTTSAGSQYKAPQAYLRGGGKEAQEAKDGYFDVCAAEQVLELFFKPLPAHIKGKVYLDAGNGDDSRRRPIAKVRVEVLCDGNPIDCQQTTDDSGCYDSTIKTYGFITVNTPARIRTTDGAYLQRVNQAPLAVLLELGQTYEADVAYSAELADLQIVACLLQESGNKVERIPLPGVNFSVYRGKNATGEPYWQGTATGAAGAFVSGLEAKDHTIVLASRPTSYQGQPIQLTHPADGAWTVPLAPGRLNRPLEFVFKPSLGSVLGTVTGANGAPLEGIHVWLTSSDQSCPPRTAITARLGQYIFENVPKGSYQVSIEQAVVRSRDGQRWAVPSSAQVGTPVVVSPGLRTPGGQTSGVTSVAALLLTPEVHMIYGTVTDANNNPVPNMVIEIQNSEGKVLARTQTDGNGRYEWTAPTAGTIYLVPLAEAGFPVTRMRAEIS